MSTPLTVDSCEGNVGAPIDRLYLVGLLPKYELKNKGSGQWNIPVLVIGGVALASGQSIFIIAASLAGVLGTIGSLTNSASMLKGQFRE